MESGLHLRRLLVPLAVTLLVGALAGCGRDASPAHTVTVFAAASLTGAFTELGESFERGHPDVQVTLNFGGSSSLARQIEQGAPADVFASADAESMDELSAASLLDGGPEVFATNRMAILVEPGNPTGIASLGDLARPDLSVVLCAEEVPCGRYASKILANAGVVVVPRSHEGSVKGVVTKVTLGEADAGIVYVTDTIAAGRATARVDIASDVNVVAGYPIAVTDGAADRQAARAFVEFVRGPVGSEALRRAGFDTP